MLFMENKGEWGKTPQGEVVRVDKCIDKIRQIYLQVQEALKKSEEKYKARHDQYKVWKSFKVGDIVWLHLNKERLQSPGKNIKDTRYVPFEVLEKVRDNVYKLCLHSYMHF